MWLPIEIAPRDGRWVLGFSPEYQSFHVIQYADWNGRGTEYRFVDDEFREVDATHWKPLPEPPK